MSALAALIRTAPGRLVAGALAVVVIGGVVVARSGATPETATPRTAAVTRANILETVTISGSIDPAAQIRLRSRTAGTLAELKVAVGDTVTAGQPLAQLDVADLEIDVRQAEADLASAQARYDKTVRGASAEDVAIARNSVDTARRNQEDAQRTTASDVAAAEDALDQVEADYVTAKANFTATRGALDAALDDHVAGVAGVHEDVLALRDALEAILRPGDITTARDELNEADLALVTAEDFLDTVLVPARAELDEALEALLAAVAAFDRAVAAGADTLAAKAAFEAAEVALDSAASKLTRAVDAPAAKLADAQGSLESAAETLSSPDSLPLQTLLGDERADLAALQTALLDEREQADAIDELIARATSDLAALADPITGGHAQARQDLADARERASSSLLSQENALRSSQLSLAKTTASADAADVASAYASLLSAQVALDRARNDLANATLRSPAAGVVASVGAQVGEQVGTAEDFIVVAVTSTLALHGTVGEAEVARLRVGQVASITVDAVGSGSRLTGKVTAIDPVATIQQGVPVYGVDVRIDVADPAIRPGMSGSASVILASRQGVLAVPNLAIRSQSGRRFVQVLEKGAPVDAEVTFGLSNDSVTEVTAGLKEGDLVVLPQARATTTTTQQQQLQQQFRGPGGGGVQVAPGR